MQHFQQYTRSVISAFLDVGLASTCAQVLQYSMVRAVQRVLQNDKSEKLALVACDSVSLPGMIEWSKATIAVFSRVSLFLVDSTVDNECTLR